MINVGKFGAFFEFIFMHTLGWNLCAWKEDWKRMGKTDFEMWNLWRLAKSVEFMQLLQWNFFPSYKLIYSTKKNFFLFIKVQNPYN
jgi:hypothetical protein